MLSGFIELVIVSTLAVSAVLSPVPSEVQADPALQVAVNNVDSERNDDSSNFQTSESMGFMQASTSIGNVPRG